MTGPRVKDPIRSPACHGRALAHLALRPAAPDHGQRTNPGRPRAWRPPDPQRVGRPHVCAMAGPSLRRPADLRGNATSAADLRIRRDAFSNEAGRHNCPHEGLVQDATISEFPYQPVTISSTPSITNRFPIVNAAVLPGPTA
jgi:hypothetical protein